MFKTRVVGSTLLAIGLAIGVSSAALGTDLVVGHGIQKVKVDVCVKSVGGLSEVASNFKYGKYFKASLPDGIYTITIRAASAGKCKGATLIKLGPLEFEGLEDLSVIATKNSKGKPTVAIFDNRLGWNEFDGPILSIKHAARIGRADVYLNVLQNDKIEPVAVQPTLTSVPKGAQLNVPYPIVDIKVGVAKTGKSKILGETPYWGLKSGKINHVVAIGTEGAFRFLRYRTENKGLILDD
jgi:hypothetical protein